MITAEMWEKLSTRRFDEPMAFVHRGGCRKRAVSKADIDEMRRLRGGGRRITDLAAQFGVVVGTVHAIVNRKGAYATR